jgi:hypothetical protein
MQIKNLVAAVVLAVFLAPLGVFAQEKNGTVAGYDEGSRMLTVKGKDWEQKAKVSSDAAKSSAALLKEGAKVKVEFDDRGGGDVRVKSLSAR